MTEITIINKTIYQNLYSQAIFNLFSSLSKEIIFEKTIQVCLKIIWGDYVSLRRISDIFCGEVKLFWRNDGSAIGSFFGKVSLSLAKWRIEEVMYFLDWNRVTLVAKWCISEVTRQSDPTLAKWRLLLEYNFNKGR